jgi:hypothetical protein
MAWNRRARRLARGVRRSIAMIELCRERRFEHSESHYARAYPLRPGHGLGDRDRLDAGRVSPVSRRRRERRHRRLSGQALRHDQRLGRLSRPPGGQGADRLDLRHARHQRRHSALARHSGRIARYHDRRRRAPLLAGRQTAADEAASGFQAQHRRADPVRRARPRVARVALRGALAGSRPDGCRHAPDPGVRRRLLARVGAPAQAAARGCLRSGPLVKSRFGVPRSCPGAANPKFA